MWDGDVGTGGITSNKDCQTCHEKKLLLQKFLKIHKIHKQREFKRNYPRTGKQRPFQTPETLAESKASLESYLFSSCWSVGSHGHPQTVQSNAKALGFPPETSGESLLLKR